LSYLLVQPNKQPFLHDIALQKKKNPPRHVGKPPDEGNPTRYTGDLIRGRGRGHEESKKSIAPKHHQRPQVTALWNVRNRKNSFMTKSCPFAHSYNSIFQFLQENSFTQTGEILHQKKHNYHIRPRNVKNRLS